MTNKFIAVATDHRYIRFYSFGGIQIGLLCFKGPVVSMVGTAEHLLLVTHNGGTFHGKSRLSINWLTPLNMPTHNIGDQNFTYSIYDTKQQCLHKDEMPVSPGSLLEWIGFSEDGVSKSSIVFLMKPASNDTSLFWNLDAVFIWFIWSIENAKFD